MQNFTEQESKLLLYLNIAKDIGANNIIINKSDCETIINLAERLIQKANGGWISVKDRLPTNFDRVLVCYHNFKLKLSITCIDSYNGFGEWEEFDKCYGKNAWKVTHWQPLPNEPKIEGD